MFLFILLFQVWWVPPVNLHTSCDLDWTYWPWDRQTCHLVVGSWTKTGWELDIQNLNGQNRTKIDSANFAKGAWDLVGGVQETPTRVPTSGNMILMAQFRVLVTRISVPSTSTVYPTW